MTRATRSLLALFALAAAVDLAAVLSGQDLAHTLAKPLLMPLLAAYAWTRRAPRLLIAALLCGWAGDTLLLVDADTAFLAGMGAFAAGHVCYLVLLGRRPGPPALAAAYLAALVLTVAALWPDLPPDMRVPVAGYSVLLTAVAFRSSALGARAGAGGALFLLSDSLIATGVAGWPQPPAPGFLIMLTYVAAQYLLVTGILGSEEPKTPDRGEERTATV